jgi:hypothetical protein
VEKDGEYLGYVVVSASRDYGPILMLSNGGKRPSAYLPLAREKATELGYIDEGYSGDPIYRYSGGLSYGVQFGERMKKEQITIHLPTGRVEKMPKDVKVMRGKDEARAAWQRAEERIESEKFGLEPYYEYNKISGVPAWYQSSYNGGHGDDGDDEGESYPDCAGSPDDPWDAWDGHAPVAGAMVLGYWADHGYPDIDDDDDTLIDDCHHYMVTDDEGATSWLYIANGIEEVSELYGYAFDCDKDGFVSWSDVTGEVDDDKPAELFIDAFDGGGSHCVTLVGYYILDEVEYLIIHNTWHTSEHDYEFGDWDNAHLYRVAP